MKDRVFIAWSGSNSVALQVKRILESQYNYVCLIGGNSDNSSRFSSVGDTVIQQIRTCNQAIVIFQNRADGCVSNNLFFELGYCLSAYTQRKVHCVKRACEDVVLPSDFDNSFVETMDDGGSPEKFAEQIVEYFIRRQRMSIDENKMFLINNRYMIRDKIVSHYSELGSKCSDYELAQYILFYMQAAYLFGDVTDVRKEIVEFKNAHNFEFSEELTLAVNMCITFFDIVACAKTEPNTDEVYLDQADFWRIRKAYKLYEDSIKSDELGIFDEWAKVFVLETLAYVYMLYANNDNATEKDKLACSKESIRIGLEALDAIKTLEHSTPCKENNDSTGLLSLLRAYIYRNLYCMENTLGEPDAIEWLKKTMHERELLKQTFDKGSIDTQLHNTFCMEYYLSLINYLSYTEGKDMDEFEIGMYKAEVQDFLNSLNKDKKENAYLKQIASWCNS